MGKKAYILWYKTNYSKNEERRLEEGQKWCQNTIYWLEKPVHKCLVNKILTFTQSISLSNYLLEKKNNCFATEKRVGDHFTQMIKTNITSTSQSKLCATQYSSLKG